MNKTNIPYLDATWNPITGCTPIGEGCWNCWAKHAAETRLRGRCGYNPDVPFGITVHPRRMDEPVRVRKPKRIGVCFMGDLFHPDVEDRWFDTAHAIMEMAPHHQYFILTKRPDIMARQFARIYGNERAPGYLWLGVSIENQHTAQQRIPHLLDIPAERKWISAEPLLGPIDIHSMNLFRDVNLVVTGCESGKLHRWSDPIWTRHLIQMVDAQRTYIYVKQFYLKGKVSHDPSEWPEWARRREMPA